MFTHSHGEINYQGIHKQNQQSQLPVQKQQYYCSTDNAQHCYDKPTNGITDKVINDLNIGDKMRGYATTATGFIFTDGDSSQPFDQLTANSKGNAFGNDGEIA